MRIYPDAVQRYTTDPASGITSQHTIKGARHTARHLQGYLGDVELHQVTEKDLVAFLASLTVAASTLHLYRQRIEALYRWAEFKGHVDKDPSRHLKRHFAAKPKPVVEHHWLGSDQVSTILSAPDQDTLMGLRDTVVLRLGFTAGLRRSEILELDWKGVNLERRQATLVGKGRKLATVYLNEATAEVLGRWWAASGQPTTGPVIVPFRNHTNWATGEQFLEALFGQRIADPGQVSRICKRYAEKTGIRFAPHDMRRTFAGIVHDRVGIEGTSAALRHVNLGTTQRYLERRQDAAFLAARDAGVEL